MKLFFRYLLRGPSLCSGDFSKNCESLNTNSMRIVKAAGVQWGWLGFMFFRAVPILPCETRNEQITREKLSYLKRLAWDQVWGFLMAVSAVIAVVVGLYYYAHDDFSHAAYLELCAIFLILISQIDWNRKHTIQVLVPGARATDKLQVLHTAATDGYESDGEGRFSEDRRCIQCGCYVDNSLLCSIKACPNYGKAYFGHRAGYCSECAAPLEDDGDCSNLNCKRSNL